MGKDVLPVAVVGVGGVGSVTLAALRLLDGVRVVGVSDKDPKTAEQAGRSADVPFFTDNRSLLAQTKPAIVFLATPPMSSPELVKACADRGIHVWKEMPLARNLEEGVALARRMEKAGLKFAVGTQRRFAPGYRRAWELRGKLDQVFLARGHYLFNWGPSLDWRGDRASAGGGAVLELGYHPIDLMVWMLGLPNEVYGSIAGGTALRIQGERMCPIYDTDDTGAVILRFGSQCVATVVTTRASGPVSEEISLHGRHGSIRANGEMCLLRDRDGNVLDQVHDEATPLEVFRRQVEAFVNAVRAGSKHYECSAMENLLNLAVIDAIYLSDKTSLPEVPARVLSAGGLSVDECLKYRPIV